MHLPTLTRFAVGTATLSIFLAVAPQPVKAFGPVVIVGDTAHIQDWLIQAANYAKTLNNDIQRAVQLKREIEQADQELKQAASLRFDSQAALNAFTSRANSSQPINAGSILATSILNGTDGATSTGIISTLEREILGATGNMQGQASIVDSELAILQQAQNAQTFAAAQDRQRQANVLDAEQQRGALLDVNSPDPTVGFKI